jgi:hypothetical protein
MIFHGIQATLHQALPCVSTLLSEQTVLGYGFSHSKGTTPAILVYKIHQKSRNGILYFIWLFLYKDAAIRLDSILYSGKMVSG